MSAQKCRGTITTNEYDGDDDLDTVADVFSDLLTRLSPNALAEIKAQLASQRADAAATQWTDQMFYLQVVDLLTEATS